MPGNLTTGGVRAAAALLLAFAGICVTAPSALAGDTGTPPGTTTTPTSDGSRLTSRVSITGTGTGGDGTQPVTYSDRSFTPPDCWYESFTPDEFESVITGRYDYYGNQHADTVYNYYYQVQSDMRAIDYHRADKGSWWLLVYNPDLPPNTGGSCTLDQGWMWVGPADPPPPAMVTPELLSRVAYGATKLPVREVTLSPAANNQKVNLATYLKFADAIPEVYVTAQIPNPPVAATVVAEPYALHVEAGTQYADPQSCDYRFGPPADGKYTLDTAGSACNITYRKSTSSGASYTLQARITWRVHWTAGTDPDGPVADQLSDGYTTAPQPVTVQEIQTINR